VDPVPGREAQKHVDPVDPDPQHWFRVSDLPRLAITIKFMLQSAVVSKSKKYPDRG
jgi:hypothetical protein